MIKSSFFCGVTITKSVLNYGSREGQFLHSQKAEVCSAFCGALLRNLRSSSLQFAERFSAICGTLLRNLQNSSPQFAETIFHNLRGYCLLKLASTSYFSLSV